MIRSVKYGVEQGWRRRKKREGIVIVAVERCYCAGPGQGEKNEGVDCFKKCLGQPLTMY